MQMRVDKLRDALKLTQPAIVKKPTLPSLKFMLLKGGKAVATDLDKMVIIEMPEATDECLVPHAQVFNLLQNVPGHDILTIKLENHTLDFSWEDGHAAFETIDAKDYPPMPDLKVRAEKNVDGNVLAKTLKEMTVYAATETSRPVLAGVALYLGEKMVAAAGDGFRMAYQELPLSFPVEETVVLPIDTVSLLEYLWGKVPSVAVAADTLIQQIVGKRQLLLSLTGNSVVFQFGKVTLIAKPIEGTPPEFKKLIPIPKNKVKVFAPDVMGALRRLKGVAYDGNKIVRMKWENSKMVLSSQAAEMGMVEASIPAATDDGPGRIALNIQYLTEYFTGKEDFVTMGISEEGSPALFNYRQFPAVVIMPMFVQW